MCMSVNTMSVYRGEANYSWILKLASLRFTWSNLVSLILLELTWTHLVPLGLTWSHLATLSHVVALVLPWS